MNSVIIPARGDLANYDYRVSLEGKSFSFRFRYNERDSSWYFSIYDVNNEPVRTGIKMVPNFYLLTYLVSEGWNIGNIVLLDSRPNPIPPLLADLGRSAFLIYSGENP